jgi:hypothetical protein
MTLFSKGDEVIVRELRTKIDMPGSTGAWVTIPDPEGSPRQAFLPYSLMDKVRPEVKVGDVWRSNQGTDWYVRKLWAAADGIVIESFTSCSVSYSSILRAGSGLARPIDKFFEEHKPKLMYRTSS